MTHDEKIIYMTHAAGICKFGFHTKDLDLLVSLYELILEKEGNTTLHDTVKVESEVNKRDEIKKKQELFDKVSTKV